MAYRQRVVRPRKTSGLSARPRQVEWALRTLVLAFCVSISIVLGHGLVALGWTVLLLALSLPTVRLPRSSSATRALRVLEAVAGAAAVASTGLGSSPYLLYLLVPTVAAGLWSALLDALVTTAAAAITYLVVGAVSGQLSNERFSQGVGQYVLIALILGPMASWARRTLQPRPAEEPLYGAAYRLLSQLRTVTRQLPGTLDPLVVTAELLDRVGEVVAHDRGGVLVRGGDARLTPLAGGTQDLAGGDVALSDDTPYAEAWATQVVQCVGRGDGSWLLVAPMVVGVRTCGLVVLESDSGSVPDAAQCARITEIVTGAALRLETALLFDDVRDLATAEERQRVAREIHDGIAQELVIVGYGIDNALGDLPDGAGDSRTALTSLRGEVTRIITELRLSLFDLRADIDPHGGLGAAISAYLRTVGTTSGVTVHITLDESPHRLPSGTEIELLRIVQEAVTNARKHSGAANLWVTCDVHPPSAHLRVEDDGSGIIGTGRTDSFGLTVMRERAQRLHGSLDIRNRPQGGTVVEVHLDGAPSRSLGRPTVAYGERRP